MKKPATQIAKLFLVLILFIGSSAWAFPVKPDPQVTPGDLCEETYSDFEEYRYEEQIPYCRRYVSIPQKNDIYETYNISANDRSDFTIDHFIPLALGGSNEPENLWPEHVEIKRLRYNLEVRLYWALRAGEVTQEEALEQIVEAKMNPPLEVTAFENILY